MFSLRQIFRIVKNGNRLRFYSISEDNPYFAKYASKLRKYQQENPTEFDDKLDELKKKQRKKFLINADGTVDDGVTAKDLANSYPRQTNEPIRIEQPELLENLSVDEITAAWKARHRDKDAICAVVQKDQFETMAKRGVEFPTFVYPVPRNDGYEIFLGQVASGGLEVHFTSLAQFHRNQSEATACLRLKFFTDFLESKQIALMAGEYKADMIGPEHAQCLANQHQIYYGSGELKRKLMLWNFNKEPNSFNHEVLIEEFEKHIGYSKEGVVVN